jgi:hypothetical protein
MPATKPVAHTLKPAVKSAKPRGRAAVKPVDVSAIEKRAAMRRVKDRLARIEEMREAQQLADAGKTQRDIADILQTTQPRVHRMLKAMEDRDAEAESPEEIILLAAANGTPRPELVRRLTQFHYTFRQRAPQPFEGAVTGSWDEVRHAFVTGLLTEREFERVRDVVKPPSS